MRSLFVYGIIGAIFGVLLFLILAAIAVPSYGEYLIPLALYQEINVFTPVAAVIDTMEKWLSWVALIPFIWLWFMVAGRLHPALARLPYTTEGQRLWPWAAWVAGGVLFLGACVLALSDSGLVGVGSHENANVAKWIVVLMVAGLAWLLISPQAFGRFGSNPLPTLSWLAAARAAGLGALFILFLGLAAKAVSAIFMIWFMVVTEALDPSMEMSVFSWTWLSIGAIALFALGSAIAFGLLPAFVPGAGNWRARISATRPALRLTALSILLGIIALPLLSSIDYLEKPKLMEAAELSGIHPLSLRLVKFCADSNCRVSNDPSAKATLKLWRCDYTGIRLRIVLQWWASAPASGHRGGARAIRNRQGQTQHLAKIGHAGSG